MATFKRVMVHVVIRSEASKSHGVNSLWDHRKKGDKEGFVVRMSSAIYHELSRTRPKLEGNGDSVGVDALAVVWRKERCYVYDGSPPKEKISVLVQKSHRWEVTSITVFSINAKPISVSKNY